MRPMIMAEISTNCILAQPLPRDGIMWSSCGSRNMIPNPKPIPITSTDAANAENVLLSDEILSTASENAALQNTDKGEKTHKQGTECKELLNCTQRAGNEGYDKERTVEVHSCFSKNSSNADSFETETEKTTLETEKTKTSSASSRSRISCQLNKGNTHQIAPIWEFTNKEDFSMFCRRYEKE